MTARRRSADAAEAPARSVTTQSPHLAQPDDISTLSRDRAIRADGCVGSSLCRPATRRPRRLALDPNRLGRACGTYAELPYSGLTVDILNHGNRGQIGRAS